jgi:GH24 family phage-related lysozyme (muramidase)
MAKFKNIVGTGLLDYVQKQINKREEIVNKQTRTPSDLQWLSNRTGWFRLSSGVDFNPSTPPVKLTYTTSETPTISSSNPQTGTVNSTTLDISGNPSIAGSESGIKTFDVNHIYTQDLAKQYVLQGGTVTSNNPNVIQKQGFDQTYTQGATDQLGYKPMPGITGVKVGTGGRWQTLMQADIDFVCYDLDQLDIMSKLYMSLGMTLFLEFGHTPYVDNNGKLQTNIRPLNFFKYVDKDILLQDVNKKRENTFGNYDAMVGTVYNFDWKANNDGSYNCSIKIMGPGGMLESLKINGSINIDFDNNTKDIPSKKHSSTLGNALYSMKQYLENREDLFKVSREGPGGISSEIEPSSIFGKVSPDSFFKSTTYDLPDGTTNMFGRNNTIEVQNSWGGLLKNIYSNSSYNKIDFISSGEQGEIVYPDQSDSSPIKNFSAYGNATQLVTGITSGTDSLDPIPIDFYSGYVNKSKINSKEELISTYITFGHLMALIQHISIYCESNSSINLNSTTDTSDTTDSKPIVYIDYHPDNNIIQRGPIECTIDPTKCIIPLKFGDGETMERIFAPLDVVTPNKPKWWSNLDKSSNASKNLTLPKELGGAGFEKNKINGVAPEYEGKLFNILINLDFAYNTISELSSNDENREVNLIEYVNTILNGINLSLGKVNNLRAFVGDDGKILRIIDEEVVEPLVPENLLTIPNFGLKSIVYDYGFNSKITPKLSSQIVIAAQARDTGGIKTFSEDVLSYQSMNTDIVDRFSKTKFTPVLPKGNEDDDKTGRTLKTYQKLYDHIYYCYALYETQNLGLVTSGINDLINTFGDLMGIRKKTYFKTRGTTLIPLEFNLTMDGISGVLPYNAFLVPNNRLPKRYRGRVAFCIFSINHNLDNNRWTTTLRGQTILLDKPLYANTCKTIEATGNPASSPNSTLVGIDFPEQELIRSEVTIGSSNISDSKFTPERLSPSDTTTKSNQTPTETLTQTTSTPDLDILAAVPFIKDQEGFEPQPYPDPKDDPNGRLSIGYGSDTITRPDGSFYKITRKSRVTEQDAERDLIRRIKTEFRPRVIQRLRDRGVDYNTVDTKIQVVFIDLAYNYGTLFYDFVEAYKTNGKQGVIGELNNRIERFDRGERGQVKTRRIAEKRYLGG